MYRVDRLRSSDRVWGDVVESRLDFQVAYIGQVEDLEVGYTLKVLHKGIMEYEDICL